MSAVEPVVDSQAGAQQELPFAMVYGQAVMEMPLDLYIPPDALEVFLEAFEGPLDPEMVAEVLDVLVKLADTGMTMLCVTHEMGFARQVAERVLFLDAGRIIEDSPPEAFFNNPQSPRAQSFLAQILH